MGNIYIKSIKVDSNNRIISATLKDETVETREQLIKKIESKKDTYFILDGKNDVWYHDGCIHVFMRLKYHSDDLVEAGVEVE